MNFIKTFEKYSSEARDFVMNNNIDYNCVIFVNGEPVSGWEGFYDCMINGIGETVFGVDDIGEFSDMLESTLSEYDIDIYDEIDEIDIEDLNSAISSLSDYYNYDKMVKVEIVI